MSRLMSGMLRGWRVSDCHIHMTTQTFQEIQYNNYRIKFHLVKTIDQLYLFPRVVSQNIVSLKNCVVKELPYIWKIYVQNNRVTFIE